MKLVRIGIALTFFLTLCLVLILVASVAMPAWRTETASARAVQIVDSREDADMAVVSNDAVIDGKFAPYFLFEPFDTTVVPPGVREELEPGEVAVSPALVDYTPQLERMFGEIVAVIDESTLIYPDEFLIYARPADGQAFLEAADFENNAMYAAGFGPDHRFRNGEVSYDNWSEILPYLALLALLPPIAVCIASVRSYSSKMLRKQSYVLQVVGASYQALVMMYVRKLVPGIALGAVGGLLTQVLFMTVDVPVPFAQFTVRHESLTAYIPLLVMMDVALVLLLSWIYLRPSLGLTVAKKRRQPRLEASVATLLFCGGILLAFLVPQLPRFGADAMTMPIMLAAFILTALGFQGALAFTIRIVMKRRAQKQEGTLQGLQYEWAAANARQVSCIGSVVGIFLIVGVFLSGLHAIIIDSPFGRNFEALKGRVAEIQVGPDCGERCLDDIISDLSRVAPDSYIGTAYMRDGEPEVDTGGPNMIRYEINRDTLAGTGLETVVDAYISPQLPLGQAPNSPNFHRFIVANASGINLADLASIHPASLADLPSTHWVDESDYAASRIYAHQGRWVLWFFGCAAMIATGLVVYLSATQSGRTGYEIASVTATTGGERRFIGALGKQELVSTLCGVSLALILGLHMSYSFLQVTPNEIPLDFIAAMAALLAAASLAQFSLLATQVKRTARQWHPGME